MSTTRHDDTDIGTLENEGNCSGPSGTRTRDLRIKRPSAKTALRSGNAEAALGSAHPPRNTSGTLQTGSSTIPYKKGDAVRITNGLAKGVEGHILELWPTKAGGVRQWVVVSGDLVRRRVLREDYLEVLP